IGNVVFSYVSRKLYYLVPHPVEVKVHVPREITLLHYCGIKYDFHTLVPCTTCILCIQHVAGSVAETEILDYLVFVKRVVVSNIQSKLASEEPELCTELISLLPFRTEPGVSIGKCVRETATACQVVREY